MLGKLGFDALLISAFLAGIKRTTCLTCISPRPHAYFFVDDISFIGISVDLIYACAVAGSKELEGRPSGVPSFIISPAYNSHECL
jgi:hypothetical protein